MDREGTPLDSFNVHTARARPSNTATRELMASGTYTEADLSSLKVTGVGKVKAGSQTLEVPSGLVGSNIASSFTTISRDHGLHP